MTRAMTLIKMFFIGSLRALSGDILRRMSEKVSINTITVLPRSNKLTGRVIDSTNASLIYSLSQRV